MLLSTESEKDNWEIPEIVQALSQAAGNPESHFAIMTVERYLSYLVKLQGSQDPILIHSNGSALGNRRNGLGHGVAKYFVFQGLKESDTESEVNSTKIILRRNKKGKIPYTEILKVKTPEDIEAIRIPSENRGQNNTNAYFASYAPVPLFMLKKIVEYNSSTSREIAVFCVKALESFEPTQAAIATLTDAPDTISPEAQEEQAGEQNEA